MAQVAIGFLIWTVEKEPNGWYDYEDHEIYRETPHWYYISDDKINCFGYAPGFVQALWHYVRSVPATIAMNRWYKRSDR